MAVIISEEELPTLGIINIDLYRMSFPLEIDVLLPNGKATYPRMLLHAHVGGRAVIISEESWLLDLTCAHEGGRQRCYRIFVAETGIYCYLITCMTGEK